MVTGEIDFVDGSPLLRDAYELAARVHAGQVEESDGHPYLEHPVAVARMLYEAGHDEAIVAAGLLHDTVELSSVTVGEIEARFGARVASLVAAMTEPSGIDGFAARKAALRVQVVLAGRDAEVLLAALGFLNLGAAFYVRKSAVQPAPWTNISDVLAF